MQRNLGLAWAARVFSQSITLDTMAMHSQHATMASFHRAATANADRLRRQLSVQAGRQSLEASCLTKRNTHDQLNRAANHHPERPDRNHAGQRLRLQGGSWRCEKPAFKHLFEGRWLQRKQLTTELQSEVRSLGGTPDDDGTMLAAARRIFINLRNTMAGSDQSIIDEVEAGEDHIKAKFETVLAGNELTPTVKQVVMRAYTLVKADHDQMRDIKHTLHAQAGT